VSNHYAAYGEIPYGNQFNCWNPLKPHMLKRKVEKNLSVNVAKAEKNVKMVYGASLSTLIMGNQQPSLE